VARDAAFLALRNSPLLEFCLKQSSNTTGLPATQRLTQTCDIKRQRRNVTLALAVEHRM
jgi:hypothetical protein